jgi:hypothetical protein
MGDISKAPEALNLTEYETLDLERQCTRRVRSIGSIWRACFYILPEEKLRKEITLTSRFQVIR